MVECLWSQPLSSETTLRCDRSFQAFEFVARITYSGDMRCWGETDLRFYQRRAAEERRAAERAVTPQARERHSDLAALYDRKVRELEADLNSHIPDQRRSTTRAAPATNER